MLNDRLGWALGIQAFPPSGTVLLQTTDGGDVWSVRASPVPDRFLSSVRFIDSLHGWMGGTRGVLVGTTDGGQTWFPARVDSSIYSGYDILNMRFYSSLFGSPVYDLCFEDSLDAFLVSGEYDLGVGVERTTDAGMHWEYRDLGVYGEGRAVSFRTSAEGWACSGYSGTYMGTFDSGRTWSENVAPDSSAMNDVKFTDASHGFMVGANGTILRYNSALLEVKDGWQAPQPFRLYGNFPNPCNPTTEIRFEIGDAGFVSLEVYDVLGREVATLANEEMKSGQYERTFDGTGLATGVYFYRLRTEGFVQTRKLLLLK